MYVFEAAVRAAVAAAAVALVAGCTAFTQDIVLQGAVARVEGQRALITPTTELEVPAGDEVIVYQRIEQKANDPYRNPWHVLKRVATGVVAESGPDGVWITVQTGAVAPRGEIQLRQEL